MMIRVDLNRIGIEKWVGNVRVIAFHLCFDGLDCDAGSDCDGKDI